MQWGMDAKFVYEEGKSMLEIVRVEEEQFILESPNRRRIMLDLYETKITNEVLQQLLKHIKHLSPRIIKLAFSAEKTSLKRIQKAIKSESELQSLCCYFSTDMEEAKTWLVSDEG